jgi:hypothetical protein
MERKRRRVSVEEGGSGPSYTPELGWRSRESGDPVASERALPEAAALTPKSNEPNPNLMQRCRCHCFCEMSMKIIHLAKLSDLAN